MIANPFEDVDSAVAALNAFAGPAEAFELPIVDSLSDPVGIALAVILDHALARGWEPDGYAQLQGYRIYRYKILN